MQYDELQMSTSAVETDHAVVIILRHLKEQAVHCIRTLLCLIARVPIAVVVVIVVIFIVNLTGFRRETQFISTLLKST